MANSSTPFGFMPYGRLNGGSPTEELQQVAISTATLASGYFRGDLVAISTGAGGGAGGTLMTASAAGIGFEDGNVVPAGVFWGCEFFSAAAQRVLWSPNYPAGTTGVVGARAWIVSDPNTLFRCVGGSSSAGATFANTDIGGNLRCLSSQSSFGNTATGQSAQLVSSTITFDTSAPWRIVDLLINRSIAGTPGTDAAAFNQIIVAPNYWATRAGTVTAST